MTVANTAAGGPNTELDLHFFEQMLRTRVQECPAAGSWGATVIAALVSEHLELLHAPPRLVGGDETPIPHAGELEAEWLPSAARIVSAATAAMEY
jgi:pyruvate/2-oxoglutarate/acetoin dehydrogenase E1 component